MLGLLTHFAQDYSYSTTPIYSTPSNTTVSAGVSTFFIVLLIVGLVLAVVSIISMWKIFTKANKPGWAAIVPVYNTIVLLEIVGRPWWWLFLFLIGVIPFVGGIVAFVFAIIVYNDLSKSFGKTSAFTVLLVLLPIVGFPMLAFGDAKYHGPAAAMGGGMPGNGPAAGPTTPVTPASPHPLV
ncbi:MAG TPA: DUF5684 domain-containing protein [Candidatus Saccharimonadales bacterium]|nr:DUF5684 domain-containing protein [Candidatus Saccharimonadales bacterium]